MKSPAFRHFQRFVTLLLAVVLVALVGRYLTNQWDQINLHARTIRPTWLIFAGIGLSVGLTLLSVNAWLLLRCMGLSLSYPAVLRVFYLSQMAKYLPGSIWTLPSRAFFYRQMGVPMMQSGGAVLWETALMLSGAICVALAGLTGWQAGTYYPAVIVALVTLPVGVVGVRLCLVSPRVRRMVTWLPLPESVSARLVTLMTQLTLRHVFWLTMSYVINWLIIGFAFMILVYSVTPELDQMSLLYLTGLFAGAWTIGFLSFLTPGGIGVRDGLLVLGLSAALQDPLPFMVSVLARILWTVAEVIGLVVSLGVSRRHPEQGDGSIRL